jgi:hypothetical protein
LLPPFHRLAVGAQETPIPTHYIKTPNKVKTNTSSDEANYKNILCSIISSKSITLKTTAFSIVWKTNRFLI